MRAPVMLLVAVMAPVMKTTLIAPAQTKVFLRRSMHSVQRRARAGWTVRGKGELETLVFCVFESLIFVLIGQHRECARGGHVNVFLIVNMSVLMCLL